jgi:hypothetical protein
MAIFGVPFPSGGAAGTYAAISIIEADGDRAPAPKASLLACVRIS